jgi:hypothetical protein
LSDDEVFAVRSGDKAYLESDYSLSPLNKETSLWFQPQLQGAGARIQVRMKNDKGGIVQDPVDRANFTLIEKAPPGQNKTFMLDQYRADPTLFARLKAKWNGIDQFLEDHGGAEFEKDHGKQRVVFGEGEDRYTLYVDKGDLLIWKEGRFFPASSAEKTAQFPLLRVAKIEERVLGFELFDVQGKTKINLNLLKAQEMKPNIQAILHEFQFIGARTRVHSMFKVNQMREIVGPDDWFLQTHDGWKKLKTAKEVDAYVAGNLEGPLLIIHQMKKNNEELWLTATLYNRSRSGSESITLPLKAHVVHEKKVAPEPPIDIEAIPHG